MPRWGPISRRKLVRALRGLGFHGPYAGGRHDYMIRDGIALTVPNPHGGDISVPLLARLLAEAGVSRREWESV